jgi:hypothetical protein
VRSEGADVPNSASLAAGPPFFTVFDDNVAKVFWTAARSYPCRDTIKNRKPSAPANRLTRKGKPTGKSTNAISKSEIVLRSIWTLLEKVRANRFPGKEIAPTALPEGDIVEIGFLRIQLKSQELKNRLQRMSNIGFNDDVIAEREDVAAK